MISSSAATLSDARPGRATPLTQMTDAELAPPAAPMAMPKQVLEREADGARLPWLRLPFFGSRVQGQN